MWAREKKWGRTFVDHGSYCFTGRVDGVMLGKRVSRQAGRMALKWWEEGGLG